MELLVDSLTKLQPYFVTPWLYQSWNLAYNVSVESDKIQDKYFYIARGIDLLAQGERQNKGNPDLRFSMGFYNQQKIGLSDEANTFRCLYQLSCIDPLNRQAKRFETTGPTGKTVIDEEQFERFCQEHPMLVRRLREALKNEEKSEIISFLRESEKIPSRYEEKPTTKVGTGNELTTPLKPLEKQFPILPPYGPDAVDLTQAADPDNVAFDNFMVARDWYIYANKPLPKPVPRTSAESQPYDPSKGERMPRYMASIIFRQYPAAWSILCGRIPGKKKGGSVQKVGTSHSLVPRR